MRLGLLVAFSLLSTPLFAAEPPKQQHVMISFRMLEAGKEKPKVFAEPKIVTGDRRLATFTVGGEAMLKADPVAHVQFGTHCEVMPTIQKDGKILLELELSVTELTKTDDDAVQVAAAGKCVRAAILATPKKTVTLKAGDVTLEATAEIVEPVAVAPPLPGFDVKETDPKKFFVREAKRASWPSLKQRYKAGASGMLEGPFGHVK